MTKASSFILRLYFAVVSAVTLFTLMFGLIDFLSITLKSYVFTAADVPDYLETCTASAVKGYYGTPVPAPGTTEPTTEELVADCQARNEANIENYKRTKASNQVRNLALIIVSAPLFFLHFRIVYRDWTEERHEKKSDK